MDAPHTLILMRHAAAAGAARDEERPLTAGGRLAAAEAGSWLRSTLPAIDAVLCSAAVRTRETLAALAIDAPVEYLDELYNAGVEDIVEQISAAPASARTLLVVGHAPGIPATAYELATSEGQPSTPLLDDLRGFPAGGIAVLRVAAGWAELTERGAELVTVRHPDR